MGMIKKFLGLIRSDLIIMESLNELDAFEDILKQLRRERNKGMTKQDIVNFLNDNNILAENIKELNKDNIDMIISEVLIPVTIDSLSGELDTEEKILTARDNTSATMTGYEARIDNENKAKVEVLNGNRELQAVYCNALEHFDKKYSPIATKLAQDNNIKPGVYFREEVVIAINSDDNLKGLDIFNNEK